MEWVRGERERRGEWVERKWKKGGEEAVVGWLKNMIIFHCYWIDRSYFQDPLLSSFNSLLLLLPHSSPVAAVHLLTLLEMVSQRMVKESQLSASLTAAGLLINHFITTLGVLSGAVMNGKEYHDVHVHAISPLHLFSSSPSPPLLLLLSSSPPPSSLPPLLLSSSPPPPLTGDGSILQYEQLLLKCRLILSQLSTGNNLVQVYICSNIMKRISNEVRIIVIFIIIIIIVLGSDKQIA